MSTSIAFDTSNYTTSLSLCVDGVVRENRKIPLPVDEGKRGLRQSDAVFHHTVHLSRITEGLRAGMIDCVGVSDKPRDVEGSYMPCFLSGVACATVLADTLGVPLYRFSHQQGHVMAALYSAGRTELYDQRLLSFHLSGGTTELLLCDGGRIECVGATLDISAGKLIDRTGVKLGMRFPCGPSVDAAARGAEIPRVRVSMNGLDCNMSGFENKIDKMIGNGCSEAEICAYTVGCVRSAVEGMLLGAFEKYGRLPVLFAGGVSSNSHLREYFCDKYDAIFPEPEYAQDNAAGIALLAEKEHNGR
ncbi:MAG: peptidase M22 [Clostridia bacterium]|nr:peptidase M22 [Clostridia bacterium]